MKKQSSLLLLIPCLLVFSNCKKERDLTRHLVIEKATLKEGDNLIYNDNYLEVHAFLQDGKIYYTGKTDTGVEGIMIFGDSSLEMHNENGNVTLEGDVSCSCTQTQGNEEAYKWLCRKNNSTLTKK